MPANPYDVESLSSALAEAEPSGPALDHDPDFQALERAAQGTPERQYGEKIYTAEPPEWPAVFAQALALGQRTRDLRVAVLLLRSGARLHGMAAVQGGLRLVELLLSQQWDTVHPQLDTEDNNDPTMRLNALLPLVAAEEALADLRVAGVAAVRGSLSLREIELGLGRASANEGEVAPTEAGVLQGLEALLQAHPEVAEHIGGAVSSGQAIAALLDAKVGSRAPDCAPLLELLRAAGDALQRVMGTAAPAGEPGDGAGSREPRRGGVGGAGEIASRADAVRELERVCAWLERHEPSNPAPLLIRRAQRLMNMSFIDIIRDMASNGLEQVELVTGKPPESS